jgi:DNA repair exonuclease SbcCD ATPase subunit
MRLRLKNFRCYEDQTFDLGDKGLTLLSAATGTGKSSILMGVHFALFGVGTKVVTHGKTSCLVELEFDGIKISRTKRPNRLLVNDQYEDKAGQAIIDEKFGETYETTGYISQNALNSFVLMGPMDKLGFLEKFAFKDVELGKIKGRCKALISEKHDDLIGITAKLEMANEMLCATVPGVDIPFPMKCKKGDYERLAKSEAAKCKNRGISARKAANNVDDLHNELLAISQLNADTAYENSNNNSLKARLVEVENVLLDIDYCGDQELSNFKGQLSTFLGMRDIEVLRKQLEADKAKLDDMEQTERVSLESEIVTIKETLWMEYSKKDFSETLKFTKQYLNDVTTITRTEKEFEMSEPDADHLYSTQEGLKKALNHLKKSQELYDAGTVYTCPHCVNTVYFQNGKLEPCGDDHKKVDKNDLNKAKKEVSELEKSVAQIESDYKRARNGRELIAKLKKAYDEPLDSQESLEEDLQTLMEYKSDQLRMEKRLGIISTDLEEENFGKSYTSFKASYEKSLRKQNKQEEHAGVDCTGVNEEDLRKKITINEASSKTLLMYTREKRNVSKNLEDSDRKLADTGNEFHQLYAEMRDPAELKDLIQEFKEEQATLEEQQAEHKSNVEAIADWNVKNKFNMERLEAEKNVEVMTAKEKDAQLSYASATMLKSKIAEAESLSMVSVIDSINIHSQLYLDHFFPDHPIAVRLTPFKQGKKTAKPQINLEIEYKGMECDITSLSGGELSRLVLAYTLALAEMFNTPLLLLDECTASLDQDMTSVVLAGIKENFSGTMVLIVAHQVVTGVFDKVILLGQTE